MSAYILGCFPLCAAAANMGHDDGRQMFHQNQIGASLESVASEGPLPTRALSRRSIEAKLNRRERGHRSRRSDYLPLVFLRNVGNPMPIASKPPSTASVCPVM